MAVRRVTRRDPATGQRRGYWMVDINWHWPDGTVERIRKRSPVQNRRGAERYEAELRVALLTGGYRNNKEVTKHKAEVPTFAIFAQEFLATYVKTNNKPSEYASKESILRVHLVPAFGGKKLDQVGLRDIERYKAKKLGVGLKKKTVNNHLTVLRRMLVVAQEWGLIEQVPRVQWLKAAKPQFDFFTFEEAERLLAACEVEWHPMVMLGLRTGMRLGELLALRWEDVDLVAGRLVVRQSLSRKVITTPKSGKSREIPLSPDTLAMLKAHRHLRGEYVICREDGSLLGKESTKWPLWRQCKRAGLRRIGWHVLRHSFASHLVMRGVPMKVVQELLGHSTLEMTMRYAHLSPDVRRDAVALLDPEGPDRYGSMMAADG